VIWFILGLLAGFLLDVLWWHKGFNKYERGWLKNLEHYHWALLFTMLRHSFTLGLSAALLIEERFQDHWFSIGSGHEKESFIIAIILGALLGLSYLLL